MRVKACLCLLGLVLAGTLAIGWVPTSAFAQCDVPIYIPDQNVGPDPQVVVEVRSAVELAPFEIEAFHMIIRFCPKVIPTDIDVSGTMIENFGMYFHVIDPNENTFEIAWAGNAPLPGGNIPIFKIIADNTMTECEDFCSVDFDYLLLESQQGEIDECGDGGLITVDHSTVVEGFVTYACNGTGVNDVLINGASQACDDVATMTNQDGQYKFTFCRADCEMCFTPSRDRNPQWDDINGTDAALILRYVVGLEDLNDCVQDYCGTLVNVQEAVADVTGDGNITPLDASKILRFWLNDQEIFDDLGLWLFWCVPQCIRITPEDLNIHVPDMIAAQVGDVSLNWDKDEDMNMLTNPPIVTFAGPQKNSEPGATEVIDIKVHGDTEAYAASLDLVYDPSVLTLTGVRLGDIVENGMVFFDDDNGDVRIVMSTAYGFVPDGTLFQLEFQVASEVEVEETILDITDATLGETPIDAYLVDGALYFEGGEAVSVLGPTILGNRPNPFNPRTAIRFELSQTGPASLRIYGADGRLVSTLVDGVLSKGMHEVYWDGRTDAGAPVSTGIYFCVLQAEGKTIRSRMLLLK
jgi:hypothetical protein